MQKEVNCLAKAAQGTLLETGVLLPQEYSSHSLYFPVF